MNPMHQLTRRPVKAAFGALLLALAGVILALSGGQFWAAVQTRAGVEETYTTVAVVTGGKRQLVSSGDIVYEDIGPTYEANEFLKEAAQKGWSIIRGQATMGLAGGYSPKLTPLTTFYQMDVDSSDTRIDNDEDVPYNFAILEIEITEVGEERVYYPREYDTGAFFNWVVSGKVLGVQAMSGDWNDPTGRNANFYLQITGAYDKEGAAAMAVVLLSITLLMFAVQKYYLEAKTAATLTGKASRARMLISDKSVTVPLTVLCSLAAIFVVMMYLCVPIGALFPTWGYKFSPLTFKWFTQVFTKYKGLKAFKDSFVLSLISAPITALLSMIISYLVVKKKFKAKGFIEAVSMLAMAVPGTVLGVGYIRGFSGGLFHTGLLSGLYGSAAILIIVFVVRSLPTGTRSGISALRQIDKSIEESAYDMGANSFRVFMTVTLPLIKDSFLSGLVTAFVRSITAISAIILLVTPQFLLITVQINEFAEKGSYSIACAFATILILITYGSVLLMNLAMKFFGTSKKIKEA